MVAAESVIACCHAGRGELFTVNPPWSIFTPDKFSLDSLGDLTGINSPRMINIDHFSSFGDLTSMNSRIKRRNAVSHGALAQTNLSKIFLSHANRGTSISNAANGEQHER
jgi:hypothetical protein